MAEYVIAAFLCGMDGSGRDYASDDEHLSLSTVLHLFSAGELLSILPKLASLSSNAGQGRMQRYEKRELH